MVWIDWYIFLVVPLSVIVFVFIAALLLVERAPSFPLPGKHAFITGGSSGVGLATALLLVKQGMHVTIVARDKARLNTAVARLRDVAKSTMVLGVCADASDYEQMGSSVRQSIDSVAPIDVFIHSAGMSHPGYFEEISSSTHQALYNVNYLGAVNCLLHIIPHMKARPCHLGGRIILISSLAGLSGVFGFTGYSGSKFALRGLAECLHMETSPFNIHVSLVCPPDVDTPMLHQENKIKPIECKLISEGSGLFSAETIGQSVLDCLHSWRFIKSNGFDGHVLSLLATGTSPASSALTVTIEFLALGLLRVVSLVYRRMFIRIVNRVQKQREKGLVRPIGKQREEVKDQ